MKWTTIRYQLKKEWENMKPIIIYTSGGLCGLCKVSQEYMKRCGVPYEERVAVLTIQDQKLIDIDQKKGAKVLIARQEAHKEAYNFVTKINPKKKKFKLPLIVDHNRNDFAEMTGGIQNYIQKHYIEKINVD